MSDNENQFLCSFVSIHYVICECGKSFPSEDDLKGHFENEHNNKDRVEYQCGVCEAIFDTEQECVDHYEESHIQIKEEKEEEIYTKEDEQYVEEETWPEVRICTEEGEAFYIEGLDQQNDYPIAFQSEVEVKTEETDVKEKENGYEQNIVCNACGTRYVASGPYSCTICRIKWLSEQTFRFHMINYHGKKYICKVCHHALNNNEKPKEKSIHLTCKICGAFFTKKTAYMTHVRLQHPMQHSCDECGKSFVGKNGLTIHKKKAHKDIEKTCAICNIQFDSKDALKRHSEMTQDGICDIRLKSCIQCGDSFTTDDLLRMHVKSHENCVVRCEECNRTFSHQRFYRVHYNRVHLGVKLRCRQIDTPNKPLVVCEVCGKKCITNTLLAIHHRIHTGEKPFQCTECPKKFRIQPALQIHMRMHTGERPYNCAHCPKSFKQKPALNRHERVHTGEKPYACQYCDKSFAQSNGVKLHVRTVHLKMPAPPRAPRNKPKKQ